MGNEDRKSRGNYEREVEEVCVREGTKGMESDAWGRKAGKA